MKNKLIPAVRPWMIAILLFSFLIGSAAVRVSGKTPSVYPFDLVMPLVLGLALMRKSLHSSPNPGRDKLINWFFLVYLGTLLISAFGASFNPRADTIHALVSIKVAAAGYFIYLLTRMALQFENAERTIISGVVLFGLILSVGIFLSVMGIWDDPDMRTAKGDVSFAGMRSNYAAALLVPIVPLTIWKCSQRKLLILLALVPVFGIVASLSKGAMLALIVGGFIALPRMWRQIARFKVLAAAALSIVLFAVLLPKELIDSNIALLDDFATRGDVGRQELWATSATAFLDSPIIGVGPGNVSIYFLKQGLEDNLAHNYVLNSLADIGLLGTIPFLALIGIVAFRCFRLPRSGLGNALFLGMVATLIHGLIEPTFAGEQYVVLFWILAALVPTAAQTTREESMQSIKIATNRRLNRRLTLDLLFSFMVTVPVFAVSFGVWALFFR